MGAFLPQVRGRAQAPHRELRSPRARDAADGPRAGCGGSRGERPDADVGEQQLDDGALHLDATGLASALQTRLVNR